MVEPVSSSMQSDGDFKYWAFISYSHKDTQWADWVHRALETYRIPRRLVGRVTPVGKVPARVYPVFRDREELPVSADLGGNIREALRQSRNLIIICSARAAESVWVNEEIRFYKQQGRADRVQCLVIDGEPNASDRPDAADRECFPPALRFQVDGSGALTGERTEPIAADARPGMDGRRNAKLKLLAGLLGVPFDELKQRDRQRRMRQQIVLASVVVLVLAALLGTWQWQEHTKRTQARLYEEQKRTQARLFEEQKRRKAAEIWEERGRVEMLGGNAPRALVWFAAAMKSSPPDPALQLMTARALDKFSEVAGSLEHATSVTSAQFSPDGAQVVTTSMEHVTRIWRTRDGALLRTLPEPHGYTRWAVYSPDGKTILTAGWDTPCKLWEATTGKALGTCGPEKGPSHTRAAYAADGTKFLTVSTGNVVEVWNAAEVRSLFVLKGHTGSIEDAKFSPDCRTILTLSEDKTLRTWSAETGEPGWSLTSSAQFGGFRSGEFNADSKKIVATEGKGITTILDAATGEPVGTLGTAQDQSTMSAEFNADGSRIVTGSVAGSATVWDTASGKPLQQLACSGGLVVPVHFTRDGTMVATINVGDVRTWEMPAATLRAAFHLHSLRIMTASFSPDGRYLLTAGDDKIARIWDTRVRNAPVMIRPPASWQSVSGLSADGHKLVTSGADGGSRVCDVATGTTLAELHVAGGSDLCAAFSPNNRQIATSSDRGRVRLWDIDRATIAEEFALEGARDFAIDAVAYSPDGRFIAAGNRIGVVGIFEVASRKQIAALPENARWITALRFDAGSRRLAILSRKDILNDAEAGTIALWDFAGAQAPSPIGSHARAIVSVEFSPDGSTLLTASHDDTAKLWSCANGELLATFAHRDLLNGARFSADGSRIVTFGRDKAIVWDGASRRLICPLGGAGEPVEMAAFSPDAALVATALPNGLMAVWDASTGKPLFVLPEILRFWNNIAFTPDGRRLAAMTQQGEVCIWTVPRLTSTPEEIAKCVETRIPLRLEGDLIVPNPTPSDAITTADAHEGEAGR